MLQDLIPAVTAQVLPVLGGVVWVGWGSIQLYRTLRGDSHRPNKHIIESVGKMMEQCFADQREQLTDQRETFQEAFLERLEALTNKMVEADRTLAASIEDHESRASLELSVALYKLRESIRQDMLQIRGS